MGDDVGSRGMMGEEERKIARSGNDTRRGECGESRGFPQTLHLAGKIIFRDVVGDSNHLQSVINIWLIHSIHLLYMLYSLLACLLVHSLAGIPNGAH